MGGQQHTSQKSKQAGLLTLLQNIYVSFFYSSFVTHFLGVVFGNAVVNVAAVGPVDNDSLGGVPERAKKKKTGSRIPICRVEVKNKKKKKS